MSETKSLNDKSIEEDSGVDVVLPKVLQAKGVSDCVPARTGTCEDLNMVVLQTFGHLGVKSLVICDTFRAHLLKTIRKTN